MHIRNYLLGISMVFPLSIHAGPEQAAMKVWVNEAIVATYSYDYKNFLEQQKQIAKYFSAKGWINYSKALNQSHLPEAVQKNMYSVNAIPIDTPQLTALGSGQWKAENKILVTYQNLEYKQQQVLNVSVQFSSAPSGQGIRGFSIDNLKSLVIKKPCQCALSENSEETTSNTEKK